MLLSILFVWLVCGVVSFFNQIRKNILNGKNLSQSIRILLSKSSKLLYQVWTKK
jgi:hypothetical protein